MATGYFTKSIFQESLILFNSMVSKPGSLKPIRYFSLPQERCVTDNRIIFACKRHQYFNIKSVKKCEKKVSQARRQECQNELENSMFVDFLWYIAEVED